ncbi:ATP-binding protein [Leucobacter insecticola]|uniref:ATP-binding protein n=1 Tax=Leucobacter insecticola TaxID=2714934 RepID=A0A6G8FH23_9MICO|nr:DUF4143 domain-containing protein [Leucobacter insecticola]QIM15668.1 ATP-binding protein [Leucobacter insecticola]
MGGSWQRIVDDAVRVDLRTFGVLVLEGPRASGKTETGLQYANSSVRLDSDPALVALAETTPTLVLEGGTPRLVDEWQLAPLLWNAARHTIDERGTPGQFIFAGSATPSDDHTRHSGAGRFGRLLVHPMSLSESRESTGHVRLSALMQGETPAGLGGLDVPGYSHAIARGGWPALVTNPKRDPVRYLQSYLDDVARVDLRGLGLRFDPARVSALLRAIARNVAGERTATKLAVEADISAQSSRQYIDALTRVFVVEELPAWSTHLRSNVRMRVQPKWHFVDPSLTVAALDGDEQRLLQDLNLFGFLFESLCIRDLRVYSQALGGRVYHYRDSSGLEVDAIVELRDGTWSAFEVKMGGSQAIEQAASNLKKLKSKVASNRQRELGSLTVLTAGNTSYAREDGVNVVSLGHLTE